MLRSFRSLTTSLQNSGLKSGLRFGAGPNLGLGNSTLSCLQMPTCLQTKTPLFKTQLIPSVGGQKKVGDSLFNGRSLFAFDGINKQNKKGDFKGIWPSLLTKDKNMPEQEPVMSYQKQEVSNQESELAAKDSDGKVSEKVLEMVHEAARSFGYDPKDVTVVISSDANKSADSVNADGKIQLVLEEEIFQTPWFEFSIYFNCALQDEKIRQKLDESTKLDHVSVNKQTESSVLMRAIEKLLAKGKLGSIAGALGFLFGNYLLNGKECKAEPLVLLEEFNKIRKFLKSKNYKVSTLLQKDRFILWVLKEDEYDAFLQGKQIKPTTYCCLDLETVDHERIIALCLQNLEQSDEDKIVIDYFLTREAMAKLNGLRLKVRSLQRSGLNLGLGSNLLTCLQLKPNLQLMPKTSLFKKHWIPFVGDQKKMSKDFVPKVKLPWLRDQLSPETMKMVHEAIKDYEFDPKDITIIPLHESDLRDGHCESVFKTIALKESQCKIQDWGKFVIYHEFGHMYDNASQKYVLAIAKAERFLSYISGIHATTFAKKVRMLSDVYVRRQLEYRANILAFEKLLANGNLDLIAGVLNVLHGYHDTEEHDKKSFFQRLALTYPTWIDQFKALINFLERKNYSVRSSVRDAYEISIFKEGKMVGYNCLPFFTKK